MKGFFGLVILFFASSFLPAEQAGVQAQSTYEVGAIPEFNLDFKAGDLWTVDVELAPRIEGFSGDFKENSETDVFFSLLDVTTVASRVIAVDAKLGLGYLARFEEEGVAHRFIQQYSFTTQHYRYRIGHRFRTDQTMSSYEKPEIRLRYRLSSDIVLNGEFIDTGEYYVKLSNEYVSSFQDSEYDLEIRLVPSLGYVLTDSQNVEFGIDYRIDGFVNGPAEHRFWVSIGYYLSL